MRNYLRSLNPQLPRSVQTLQLGGLLNAIGNGLILAVAKAYAEAAKDTGAAASDSEVLQQVKANVRTTINSPRSRLRRRSIRTEVRQLVPLARL